MDLYLTSLALGAVGLVAMAFSGFARHGHGSHGHATQGHAGHAGGGHGHAGYAHAGHAHAGHAHTAPHGRAAGAPHSWASSLASLASPRSLFSICLGLGTAGLLLRPTLGGDALTFLIALAAGVIFERVVVTPIWNFGFRFESAPALTLESAVTGEATAVTAFDANGQGLIAVEIDGRIVQLLGTLQAADRALRAKVVVGARLRVEDVDAARNRCTVSLQ
jgi:hypothetical protein